MSDLQLLLDAERIAAKLKIEAMQDSIDGCAKRVKELSDRLRAISLSVEQVVKAFQADEDAGFRSRDRQFALRMLAPKRE